MENRSSLIYRVRKFLFGAPPKEGTNTVFYQTTPPQRKGGLFRVNQIQKADLWFDTTDGEYTPHVWDGRKWKKIPEK